MSNMDLLHEYLLYYRYHLFKNTCYEMTLCRLAWHQYKSLFYIIEFGMLLLKLDILRHRIMGTHHVQYSVLKTPEQTKQRPASLIYSKQHDLTKNGFLT